jgi:hypothetical protein
MPGHFDVMAADGRQITFKAATPGQRLRPSLTVHGPAAAVSGETITFGAEASNVDSWAWLMPDGTARADAVEISIRATSPGEARVVLVAVADGKPLEAVHELSRYGGLSRRPARPCTRRLPADDTSRSRPANRPGRATFGRHPTTRIGKPVNRPRKPTLKLPNRARFTALSFACLVSATLFAACADDEPRRAATDPLDSTPTSAEAAADSTSSSTDPTPPADEPATSTTETTAAAELILEDGEHWAIPTEVDVEGRTITFDLLQYLEGDEAAEAYREEHPEDPDGRPDGGVWIVNDNPQQHTLPVAPDADLVVANDLGQAGSVTLEDLAVEPLSDGMVWLTVIGDTIVAVREVYAS